MILERWLFTIEVYLPMHNHVALRLQYDQLGFFEGAGDLESEASFRCSTVIIRFGEKGRKAGGEVSEVRPLT